MSKFAREQLRKCSIADVSNFNDNDLHIVIPKLGKMDLTMQRGCKYLVELAQYIVNPPDGFTLADNWNKGITPKEKYLIIEVVGVAGKMLKTDAVGFDYANNRTTDSKYKDLWLPSKGVKALKQL